LRLGSRRKREETIMLKWLYFVVVTAFLAAVLWMINDVRLKANRLVDRLDRQLPPILDNTELAVKKVNEQLPPILKNSEQAAQDLNTHLPQLLKTAQQGVDQLAGIGKRLGRFGGILGGPGGAPWDRDGVRVATAMPPRSQGHLP
jgi:hypothetical protein